MIKNDFEKVCRLIERESDISVTDTVALDVHLLITNIHNIVFI